MNSGWALPLNKYRENHFTAIAIFGAKIGSLINYSNAQPSIIGFGYTPDSGLKLHVHVYIENRIPTYIKLSNKM